MRGRRQPKRLPHIHHSEANTRALRLAKPGVELRHAGFRSVRAAKPDRPTPQKIADHDPIGMTLADRNLVDPDDQRTRRALTLAGMDPGVLAGMDPPHAI